MKAIQHFNTQPNACKAILLGFVAVQLALPSQLLANPAGEAVTHGSATFERSGNHLIIRQGTDKLITKWDSFSIAEGEHTQFVQPNSSSAALNRVVGGSRSLIDGQLSANGKVILINPAGVTVGPTGVVNVNSFTASTHDLTDEEFIGGGDFLYKGASQETVENHGTIRASGGDAILIAKHVKNTGNVEAPNGVAALVGGTEVLVKPAGEERIFIKPTSETGATVTQSVTGRIAAASAEVKAAGNPYAAAINLDGLVQAPKAKVAGGQGDTRMAGKIKSQKLDGNGGDVAISGKRVLLASTAVVDASGTTGGSVKVGGGFQGKDTTIENAEQTIVSAGAQILADATGANSAGGTVIVWADDTTAFYGHISAQGVGTGSGGFAEVSGKSSLIFEGTVNLASELGSLGTLLLDPMNIEVIGVASATTLAQVDQFSDLDLGTITSGQPGSRIRNTTINAATANVVLQATNDIIVAAGAPISMTNVGVGISLQAGNNITINSTITTRGGAITLLAGDSSSGVPFPVGGGNILINSALNTGTGGIVNFRAANNINLNANLTTGGGAVSMFAGDSTLGPVNPAGGNITTATSAMNLGTVGNATLRAANNVNLGGAIASVGGTITVLAGDATSGSAHPVGGGNITGTSTLNAGLGGSVNLRAANHINLTGALSTGGGAVSMVAGDASLGAADPAGGGNLSIAAVNTGAGGNVNLRAANNVNLNSTVTTNGGAITVLAGDSSTGSPYSAGGGNLTTTLALNSGAANAGNVTLRAANNVNVNNGITAVGGSVSLIAGDTTLGVADPTGSVTTSTAAVINVGAGTTGNVTLEGANVNINRAITLGNGNLTVRARTGDVQIRGTSSTLTHGNGTILLDAAQNVILKDTAAITQSVGPLGGSTSLIARSGDLILDGFANTLTRQDGTMNLTAGRDILVYASVAGGSTNGGTTLNVNAGNDLVIGNGISNYFVDSAAGSLDSALIGDRMTSNLNRNARLISYGQVNVEVANDLFILASTTSAVGSGSATLGYTSGSGNTINVNAKTLSIVAGAVNLLAGLGHVQPQFNAGVGIDPTGLSDINVTLSGGTGTGIAGKSLVLRGGDGPSSSAILGTGGEVASGTARSSLNVNVEGGVLLQGGNSSCYAIIGNSGISSMIGVNSDGVSGGKITVSATGDVDLRGGYGDYSRAVIGTMGNRGYQTMDVNVNVGGNLNLRTTLNAQSSASIGAVTPDAIDSNVYVAVGGNLTLQSTAGYAGIGSRNLVVTPVGEVQVLVGGDISITASGLTNLFGTRHVSEASISGSDLTNVAAGGTIIVTAHDEAVSTIGSFNANSATVIQNGGDVISYSSTDGQVVFGGRSVPDGLVRSSDQSLTFRSAGDLQITDPIVATGNGNILIEAGATFASGALWGANASSLNGAALAGSTFASGSFAGTPLAAASGAAGGDGRGAFTVFTDDGIGTSITTENGNLTLLSQAFTQVVGTAQGVTISDGSNAGDIAISSATGDITVAGFHDILVDSTANVSTDGNLLLAAWRDLDIAAGGQIHAGQKVTLVVDEQAGAAAGYGWFRNAGDVTSGTNDIVIYAVYGAQNVLGMLEYPSQVILGNLSAAENFAPAGSLDGKFATSYQGGGPVHGTGYSQYLAGNGVSGPSSPAIWYKLPADYVIPPIDPPVDPPTPPIPPVITRSIPPASPVVPALIQLFALNAVLAPTEEVFLEPEEQIENELQEGDRLDERFQAKRFAMQIDKEKYAAAVPQWGLDANRIQELSRFNDREYFIERKSFLADAFAKRNHSEAIER